MKPKFRPTLGDLKQHLTCSLCSEYLTEAATINKCLHSFCHRCIVRHLATSNSCPTCNKVLHPRRPLSKIRRDRTLQRLVYKTVPGLLKRTEVNESSRELDPELSDPLFPSNDYFSICLEQKSRGSEIGPLTRIADSVLSLVSDDHKIDEPRYLFCAAIMKLKILKKFLSFKFDLSSRYEIGMMCCNELFDDDCTLLDVAYISKWTVAEPLRLEYLILDKEKITMTHDKESSEPVTDILPGGHPHIDNPPQSVSKVSVDLPTSDVQCSPEPDDPPDLNATIAPPVSTELAAALPSTPSEPSDVQSKSTAKKKRGRKPKSSVSAKVVSDDSHPEKNSGTHLDSVVQSEPTPLAANTNATSVADITSAKRRGRKRKLDSVLIVASVDEKKDDFQSKKRSSRFSGTYVEAVVPADVTNGNPDTTSTKKPKAVTSNDEPLIPDSVVPEGPSSEEGDEQLVKADQISLSCESRIGTLKISLDGQQVIRNVTGQKDNADLRRDEEKKGHLVDDLTKGQYRLKRKDDLRVQLSRKIKTSHLQDDEGISKKKPELPGDRKKKVRARKTAQLPQKTRKRVEVLKSEVADHLDDHDYLKVTPRRAEKKCTRVAQKLSSGDYGSSESELYRRSSVIRKKKSPSITETPSPVVYDTDIETLPFLSRCNDKKVTRFLGRKSALEKIPKAVSISTIPPTFVLAAGRKQGNQNRDKTVDGRQPVPLKVYLRMVDDRKLSVAHDRTDDCFMVSSTVADDDAELAEAGSGNNSVDGSPGGGSCEDRAPVDNGSVSGCAEQTRLQPSVVSELSPFGNSVSDPRTSVGQSKSLAVDDAPRPPPCVESSALELIAERNKLLVPSTGSVTSGTMDRGQKRKRLESVISSLKPVASVLVSTDLAPPPQSIIPGISSVTRDSSASTKFSPPAPLTRTPEKPNDTTPSLLHRLVSREPLNIPVPPLRHQWQQQRATVCPLARFPPGLHYPVRAQGQFREPRNTQRQHQPRVPRRGSSVGQQVRAVRYPSATNAHIAAAAYAMGLLQVNRPARPPIFHRGWTPEQERLRFLVAGASDLRPSVVRTQLPEPNGYDAPLELTTKSRDLST